MTGRFPGFPEFPSTLGRRLMPGRIVRFIALGLNEASVVHLAAEVVHQAVEDEGAVAILTGTFLACRIDEDGQPVPVICVWAEGLAP